MSQAATDLFELNSEIIGTEVEISSILPPDFESYEESLPLLIYLHGGGGDRRELAESLPIWQSFWDNNEIPPLVVVSFSSGPLSYYAGNWEKFVVDELPNWAADTFNTRTDRDGTIMFGVSMGGYGSLKIGFKYPERFKAIAPMEPAIEPFLERTPGNRRNTFHRMEPVESLIWGSPLDEKAWLADNPATIAKNNADKIRESGLDIYLEVGDKDYLNLHDGAEFMHRILWDNDIRHEYHLVRWADHLGSSFDRRMKEACRFLAASLAGGLDEPNDLPLTEDEQAYANWLRGGMALGEPEPAGGEGLADPERGLSLLRHMWEPLRELASDDPDMKRAYAKLKPTK